MNLAQPTHGQEPIDTQAVIVREQSHSVAERLPLDELHEQLLFIRQVMAKEMREGQDYGNIPGCGDKPGLFQPGAQKLLLTFKLTPEVKKEVLRELPHPSIFGHREYEFTLSLKSAAGREWAGVGTCSTFESKYRYRKGTRKCPECGKETIYKDKKGPGYYCWSKKGGCGIQFISAPAIKDIEAQSVEDTENPNPAEYWNTVRKMAFKRALVHGAINATNTSELWSQDLEDLPQTRSASTTEEYGVTAPEEDNVSFEATEPQKQAESSKPPSQAAQAAETPKKRVLASPTRVSEVIRLLKAGDGGDQRNLVTDFLVFNKVLKHGQQLEEWPLAKVPLNGDELLSMIKNMDEFAIRQREQNEVSR